MIAKYSWRLNLCEMLIWLHLCQSGLCLSLSSVKLFTNITVKIGENYMNITFLFTVFKIVSADIVM